MSRYKNRVKKRLEKEENRRLQKEREALNEKKLYLSMIQEEYDDTLHNRDDARQVVLHIRQLGIPRRPTINNTMEELDKVVNDIPKIPEIISNYIDNEIDSNPRRLLNIVDQHFRSENSSYKYNKLREIARQNLEVFADVEALLKDYLEDEEKYETLFNYERNNKDIQRGMENLVDNILIDYGVNVSKMEKDFKKNKEF